MSLSFIIYAIETLTPSTGTALSIFLSVAVLIVVVGLIALDSSTGYKTSVVLNSGEEDEIPAGTVVEKQGPYDRYYIPRIKGNRDRVYVNDEFVTKFRIPGEYEYLNKCVKYNVLVTLLLISYMAFTPSKVTSYKMLAAYGVEQAASNPDVQRLAGKSLELIERTLDGYLKENKEGK